MNFENKLKILLLSSALFVNGLAQTVSFTRHQIQDEILGGKKVHAADIDRDGDLDLVSVTGYNDDFTGLPITWYEDISGRQDFVKHIISDTIPNGRAIWADDMIPGGYLEVLSGNSWESPPLMWTSNEPTDTTWEVSQITTDTVTFNYTVQSFDVDEDGILDVVICCGDFDGISGGTDPDRNKLDWYKGDNEGNFTDMPDISGDWAFKNAVHYGMGDWDEDGDLDAVGISSNMDGLWSFRNMGNPASTGNWFKRTIDHTIPGGNTIQLTDLDLDGDLDVLAVSYTDGQIAPPINIGNGRIVWLPNDGSNSGDPFLTRIEIVNTEFKLARTAFTTDMDGDGDMDVLGCAQMGPEDYAFGDVSWFENDGSQNFTKNGIIIDNSSFLGPYWVVPIDLDGDGDIDVIGSAQGGGGQPNGNLSWWENEINEEQLIAADDADSAFFWGGDVVADFSMGTADTMSVYYTAGAVMDTGSHASDIRAINGYGVYTLTTQKTGYLAKVAFYYGTANVPQWGEIGPEQKLTICRWDQDNEQWVKAGTGQEVDTVNNIITVHGINSEMTNFSQWTLGIGVDDTALPIFLSSFDIIQESNAIQLNWTTASELENLGFEILRKTKNEEFRVLASFKSDTALTGAGTSSFKNSYRFRDYDVESGEKYTYQLKQYDFNGRINTIAIKTVVFGNEISDLRNFVLKQNYPNPFNLLTSIEFEINNIGLNGSSEVNLTIYDEAGRKIRQLISSDLGIGKYRVHWNGRNDNGHVVSSGMYIYTLQIGSEIESKRLVLIK